MGQSDGVGNRDKRRVVAVTTPFSRWRVAVRSDGKRMSGFAERLQEPLRRCDALFYFGNFRRQKVVSVKVVTRFSGQLRQENRQIAN